MRYYARFFKEGDVLGKGSFGVVAVCTHLLDDVELGIPTTLSDPTVSTQATEAPKDLRRYSYSTTEGKADSQRSPKELLNTLSFKIHEETLQNIATVTDGKYFRATNNSKLKEIYKDIDALEKSKIEPRASRPKITRLKQVSKFP